MSQMFYTEELVNEFLNPGHLIALNPKQRSLQSLTYGFLLKPEQGFLEWSASCFQ